MIKKFIYAFKFAFLTLMFLSQQAIANPLMGAWEIAESKWNNENVKLSSFGNFETKDKKARPGRNPKTGVEAKITPRRVLSFKASNLLKKRINN